MKIGLLHIGVGLAVLYAVTRPSSSSSGGSGSGGGGGGGGGGGPRPGTLGGGGGGGKRPTGPGGLSGTGTSGSVPGLPPNTPPSPFRWTPTCLPIIREVEQTGYWCRLLGVAAPTGLTALQYRDYAIKAAMGACYPPPADPVTRWGKERVSYYYGYYLSFLRGLVQGKRLTGEQAQAELDRVWAWLESIDPALVVTLDPWIVSRW